MMIFEIFRLNDVTLREIDIDGLLISQSLNFQGCGLKRIKFNDLLTNVVFYFFIMF